VLIDNLSSGFDLYNIQRTTPTRSMIIPTKKKFVKQGAFAESGTVIACGSDHGRVYIFSFNKCEELQTLQHTKGSYIYGY
jgi:hypothetical protein